MYGREGDYYNGTRLKEFWKAGLKYTNQSITNDHKCF